VSVVSLRPHHILESGVDLPSRSIPNDNNITKKGSARSRNHDRIIDISKQVGFYVDFVPRPFLIVNTVCRIAECVSCNNGFKNYRI
jgi:hypothetical protein